MIKSNYLANNSERYNFAVPKNMICTSGENELVLPVFTHLVTEENVLGYSRTTVELVMNVCGYTYNSKSKTRGYYQKVTDTLNKLLADEIIDMPVISNTGEIIEDFTDLSPTAMFRCSINWETIDIEKNNYGYVIVYINPIKKILDLKNQDSDVGINVLINVYTYICSKIFVNWNGAYADIPINSTLEEFECKLSMQNKSIKPEYRKLTIKDIYDDMHTYSDSVIYRALVELDRLQVIHHRNLGNKKLKSGITRNRGNLYILDKRYWEAELNHAEIAYNEFLKSCADFYGKSEKEEDNNLLQ